MQNTKGRSKLEELGFLTYQRQSNTRITRDKVSEKSIKPDPMFVE